MNDETVRGPLEHPVGRWQYQRCARGWEVYDGDVVICWLEDQPWAESNARRICEIGDLPEGFARRASRNFCENTRLRAENERLREALSGAVTVLDSLRTYGLAKYDCAYSRAGSLVYVAPTIDEAKELLTPNAVLSRRRAAGFA